jgi:hypothetical protein
LRFQRRVNFFFRFHDRRFLTFKISTILFPLWGSHSDGPQMPLGLSDRADCIIVGNALKVKGGCQVRKFWTGDSKGIDTPKNSSPRKIRRTAIDRIDKICKIDRIKMEHPVNLSNLVNPVYCRSSISSR